MDILEVLEQVRELLRQKGRITDCAPRLTEIDDGVIEDCDTMVHS